VLDAFAAVRNSVPIWWRTDHGKPSPKLDVATQASVRRERDRGGGASAGSCVDAGVTGSCSPASLHLANFPDAD
ncbi:MAG: hypothetical protein JWM82_1159, partial [Myxococcales bacterium]|nr:hypothetical protein [Myxococcales bacterium]